MSRSWTLQNDSLHLGLTAFDMIRQVCFNTIYHSTITKTARLCTLNYNKSDFTIYWKSKPLLSHMVNNLPIYTLYANAGC